MTENDIFDSKHTDTETIRNAIKLHEGRHNILAPLEDFRNKRFEAALALTHMRALSYEAITTTYPDLIKQTHFEELEFTDLNGDNRTEPVFTLWTAKGHTVTTRGEILLRGENDAFKEKADHKIDLDTLEKLGEALGNLSTHLSTYTSGAPKAAPDIELNQ